MYHHHTTCRACGYGARGAQGIKASDLKEKLITALDLGIQPLANDFQNEAGNHAGYAPLKVLYCPRCSLAQLSVVVDPDILYSNYAYITSSSDMMKAHFAALLADIQKETSARNVVEIGSNTGDFLAFCIAQGAGQVLGIDPAGNLAEIAAAKNIPTIISPFDWEAAVAINERMIDGVDLVIARHVFCHIDNWKSFVSDLGEIGNAETLYVVEVPYVLDMLKIGSFDQCYHEHLSYLTLKAVEALLQESGLHIHAVKRYPIHGGAIAIMLRKDASKVPTCCVAGSLLEHDVTLQEWGFFAERAKQQQIALRNQLDTIRILGKRVAGLGASAKSTVWINACGLTRDHIAFIADNTPQKQYTFSPGTDIPIVDEGAILRELPDYVVLFAWNFAEECLGKFALARSKGVKFIIPVPEIRIV